MKTHQRFPTTFRRLTLSITLLVLTPMAHGQGVASKSFQIEYGANSWNQSSKSIDQAYMFVRDKISGKVAKVLVQETEPDSSVFNGKFAIDWKDTKASNLDFFVPAEKMRANESAAAIKNFNALLQAGKVTASPILMTENEKSYRIDVYDTEAQLRQAEIIKKKQEEIKAKEEHNKLNKPLANEGELQAAKMAERAQIMMKLAAAEAKREADRLRLGQLEEQRRAEEKRKAESASNAEKKRRKDQAEALAKKGQEAYSAGQYKKAEALFKQASEVDALNDSFFFMYGVALYRNDKFNDALVTLKLAKTDAQSEIEKTYYIGLIHYRMQELDSAINNFRLVRNSESPNLAPSAAFYEGICHFAKESWSKSQESFEWVLDHSNDPGLDEKADEYLEQIANAIQAEKLMAKKWRLTASAGLNYDSNILFTPDNDTATSSATDKGGNRTLLSGELTRKFYHKKESDVSAGMNTMYMYSFDSQFNRADPWLSALSSTFNYRGTTLNKQAFQYALKPSVESLFMDATDTGSRSEILSSIVLKNELTFVKREDYFAAYGFEVRMDNSKLSITNDSDNADAIKYIVDTTHTTFLDKAKKKALIGKLAYVANDAKGANKNFNRVELGITYASPWERWKNTVWTAGLTAQLLNYPEADAARKDTDLTLSGSLSRVLNEEWSTAGTASYTENSSNIDTNQYTRFSLMAMATYSWSQ